MVAERGEDAFDRGRVPPHRLQPAGRFAGTYAGEHVAGTEFVIGAVFVGAGASAADVIAGLLIGNTLAVLTWVLITAPIAIDTRLTLYAYLRRIAGPHFLSIYSVINGVLFLGLAGAMITVSASSVRVFYNSLTAGAPIPPQIGLFPTDIRFVAVALGVGAVVVLLAVLGFKRLAQFASALVPWMICMFLVGAITLYPALAMQAGLTLPALSLDDLWTVLSQEVYRGAPMAGPFWAIENEASSIWSIAAFAWAANLAMHGALGDMTLLRFAKRKEYAWFSALGMFIGHFAAWIFAGVMGAGAAALLGTLITDLDPGAVASQALGGAGIIAVIVAGWTTSNPTLYRAGLAFHSLHPEWSRRRVTAIVGAITVILACSPFVFSQLLGYVGWMGLILAPVGAIIVTEHWIFPRLGLVRYWSTRAGKRINLAAVFAWAASGGVIGLLYAGAGIHQFFLLIPAWVTASVVYLLAARALGAPRNAAVAKDDIAAMRGERAHEEQYLSAGGEIDRGKERSWLGWGALVAGYLSLLWAVLSSGSLLLVDGTTYTRQLPDIRDGLIWPSLAFFVCAVINASAGARPVSR